MVRLILLLIFIAGVTFGVYLFFNFIFSQKGKIKINWKAAKLAGATGLILLGLLVFALIKFANPRDTWCDNIQNSLSYPPTELKTAADFFEKGNYDYDTGRCKEAIVDYTKSIEINPKYPQAFNNRAYTYMRMQNYKAALADLNKALELDPDYINALMNRGDIHNYYYEIDKNLAIADYEKIISLAGTKGTSVCGHLAMAQNSTKNIMSFFLIPYQTLTCRNGEI
jgi:tetratricopeptide (TPR) repeat protein